MTLADRSPVARRMLAALTFLTLIVVPSLAFADEDAFTSAMAKGPVFAGLAAFLGGLSINLTPCVYPLIVITTAVFGAKQAKSRGQAASLSTAYVAGIAVLYTLLLVVTALLGGTFGAVLQNRWVIVGIASIFVALAASMFGAFELTLPESVMQRLSGVGGVGYGGAFSLGLVSGLIAAPCSGPVTIGMMAWIGKTGNVGLGAIVGFTFALGLGLPTWVVGTFAASLPKGGKWMVWVKSFFGCTLLGVALFFLKDAFPVLASPAKHETTFILIAAAVCLVGLAMGAVHVNWDDGGVPTKARKAIGIVATVLGGFMVVAAMEKPKEASAEDIAKAIEQQKKTNKDSSKPVHLLEWLSDEEKAVTVSKAEKRPLMLDFRADWCGACKELEKETFSDANVKVAAGNFVAVRVDATNEDDPKITALTKKYDVKGLPTVVIIDSTGKERKRFNEFVKPDAFLAAIHDVD